MQAEHAEVEETAGNRGAGLAIGRGVGQFVVLAESLVVVAGTEAAGDIELLRGDVVPDGCDGCLVVLVAGIAHPVGHTAVEIQSTDGVPLGCTLLDGRQMVLPVLAVHTLVGAGGVELADAPAIQEELAALQVTLLARQLIEPHQSHLDDRMTGCHLDAVLVEDAQHIVRSLAGAVQQFVLARRLVVGNGGLDEFRHVECLVREVPVAGPLLAVVPRMQGVVDGEVRLDVSIGFLGRADEVHYPIAICLQALVLLRSEHIGSPFQHLIDFGVVVGIA